MRDETLRIASPASVRARAPKYAVATIPRFTRVYLDQHGILIGAFVRPRPEVVTIGWSREC